MSASSDLDRKSFHFLRAIEYKGGSATTSEIRSITGLNANETQYRFRKLNDKEYITVDRVEGDPRGLKIAELTGAGRRELERGLEPEEYPEPYQQVDLEEEFESELGSIREDVLELKNRMDSYTYVDDTSEKISQIEQKLEGMEQQVSSRGSGATDEALRTDFEQYADHTSEWMEFAEMYFLAINSALEEELGIDFNTYLEQAAVEKEAVEE